MPMCFVDIDREPVRTRSATRKRSVSFGRNRPVQSTLRSTGTGTVTTYHYDSNPPYIPPAPVPANFINPKESGWPTVQKIPGAFPEQTSNTVDTAISGLPARLPLRRKSFGEYLPNPLGWASDFISGKKENSSTTSSIMPKFTPFTPSSKMTTSKSPLDIDENERVEHERTLRMYAEQRHQELLKQQLLEIELKKATDELQLRKEEEEARRRLFNVSALAAAEQANMAVAPYHHHHHHHHQPPPLVAPAPPPLAVGYLDPCAAVAHHHLHHHHSRHHYTWKYSHLSPEEIAHRRYRREHHRCSRCHRIGHYSKECRYSPMPHRRSPSPRGYIGGSSRSVGGYSTEDEDWELVEDDDYETLVDEQGYPVARRRYEDDELVEYGEKKDNGVLVYYDGGAAPGKAVPRASVRHVIGV